MHETNFKEKRIRDKKHLKFLRSLLCVNCGISKPLEAAHIRSGSLSGVGIKPCDSRTVPLCTKCHFTQHNKGERTFWGQRMDAAIQLCGELYANTGEFVQCHNLIQQFLSSGRNPT